MSILKITKYTIFCVIFSVVLVFVIGLLLPEFKTIPVKNATTADWSEKSFWAEPWGSSLTHKGIDIFAKKGTDLLATVDGFVLRTANWKKGGKIILILGPKWKIHYYAHLDSINVKKHQFVTSGQKIGTVGDSGNAKGKPPHLHYTISTIYPRPWAATNETHGSRKMFYLDPHIYLTE
ncbi:MAG: M23 family metallopeptidase [Rhizobiales bacterium]|nr:M23 family metallopeptidase [Hyphomicrobiales bacterium]